MELLETKVTDESVGALVVKDTPVLVIGVAALPALSLPAKTNV